MRDWDALLTHSSATRRGPRLRQPTVCRVLRDRAPANAVFSLDTSANKHFAARINVQLLAISDAAKSLKIVPMRAFRSCAQSSSAHR